MRAQLKKTFETGDAQEFSYRLIATDGNVHEFKATVNSFSHAGIPRAVVISIDISELRRTEKILDIYSHAFENMAEGMILTSADGTMMVDKAFTAVTGLQGRCRRRSNKLHCIATPKFADMHDAAQDSY